MNRNRGPETRAARRGWLEGVRDWFRGAPCPQGVELHGARLLEGVRIGRGPSIREIEGLARHGFRAIVVAGTEGETGERLSPSVEASWAHTFGLEHRRLYVDGRSRDEDVAPLRALLEELPRPLYLHSPDGERAEALATALLASERQLARVIHEP